MNFSAPKSYPIYISASSNELMLATQHLTDFMKTKGVDMPVVPFQLNPEKSVQSQMEIIYKDAAAIRLELQSSVPIVDSMPALPSAVRWMECADSIFPRDGGWWPDLLMPDLMRRLIVEKAKTIDLRYAAYVYGTGRRARIMSGVMLSLGISRLRLFADNESELAAEKELLNRVFLGANIDYFQTFELTRQTLPASILVVGQDVRNDPETLTDLTYFNFMVRNGVVVDLNLDLSAQSLLAEAQRADYKTISTLDISAEINFEFLRRLKLDQRCTKEEYVQSFQEYALAAAKQFETEQNSKNST